MVQNFKQVIYNCANSAKNFPNTLTAASLIDGSAFEGYSIIQLGVRALPGTKFYINGNKSPVIVGFTGLFDIDLSNGGSIETLAFDPDSIQEIEKRDTAYLVVDMAYTTGGNN